MHLDVAQAVALIQDDEQEGVFTWTAWDQLSTDAGITVHVSGSGPNFTHVDRDWWTLLTIISKIQWMKDSHVEEDLDDLAWMHFAATEIDFFHVRFRSMLDQVATLLARCGAHPKSVPQKFFDLRHFLENAAKRASFGPLGEAIHAVMQQTSWADDVKRVRDDIVHRGASTLVFSDQADILFQIHQREKRLVLLEGVMHNENIVDFRRYAATTLGALLLMLEDLAPMIRAGFCVPNEGPGQGWNRHGGLKLLRDWLQMIAPPAH